MDDNRKVRVAKRIFLFTGCIYEVQKERMVDSTIAGEQIMEIFIFLFYKISAIIVADKKSLIPEKSHS